jgi:phage repressor protein C with HTH and peptisase S24 domain
MSVGERIKSAASRAGGQKELGAKIGVSARTLSDYISGKSSPQLRTLGDIADAAGVSLQWLVFGTAEEQLSTGQSQHLVSSYDPDDDEVSEGYSHETWKAKLPGARPEIDVRLGAGEGTVGQLLSVGANGGMSGHRVVAEWVLPESFLKGVIEANASRTIVMEIVGDSMQPTYQPGDRVLVDLAQTRLVADTVYAISDGYSEPQIKRLQRVPFSDPPRVRIISDNPALETDEVELERVHIIGRICGVMARR